MESARARLDRLDVTLSNQARQRLKLIFVYHISLYHIFAIFTFGFLLLHEIRRRDVFTSTVPDHTGGQVYPAIPHLVINKPRRTKRCQGSIPSESDVDPTKSAEFTKSKGYELRCASFEAHVESLNRR